MSDDPRANERIRRQRARLGEADPYETSSDPFDKWFWQMERYFNSRSIVDPETVNNYRRILGHIPVEQLEQLWHDYISREDIGRSRPLAGVFLGHWKRKQADASTQKQASQSTPPRDHLRAQMFPLIHKCIAGDGFEGMDDETKQRLRDQAGKPPEWMWAIAEWASNQEPRDPKSVYKRALDLFDEERAAYEETDTSTD